MVRLTLWVPALVCIHELPVAPAGAVAELGIVNRVIELISPSIKSKRRLSWSVFCPGTDLVAQIEFTEWTPDGHLRHSKFVGVREDKGARDVARERF